MKTTEKQLKDKLIYFGMNKANAKKLSKKHISYLNRVYPEVSLKTKANICMTLGH